MEIQRKPGTVPFQAGTWVKRYVDERKWRSLREETILRELREHYFEGAEHQMWCMKEGHMSIWTKYAEYMYLPDSTYQDEIEIPKNVDPRTGRLIS